MIKKQMLLSFGSIVLVGIILLLVSLINLEISIARENKTSAFEYNKRLGKGGNWGNILYQFDKWDKKLEQEHLDLIKSTGFNHLRINTGPFGHIPDKPPYTIRPEFFERLDWTVEQALSQGLTVIIDNHEYWAMGGDPIGNREKFLSTWKQISEHYKKYPDNVYFGVLNEPNNNLTAYLWNYILKDVIEVIREKNPSRILMIGPASWNGIRALEEFELPEDDRNIIVEIHYYSPHRFTHQGASWSKGSEAWLGMKWSGTPEEKQAVIDDFEKAVDWANRHNRPLYLGEFGAYKKADMESRICWTRFIRETAEKHGISWALWNLMGTSFGVYDESKRSWILPLLETLIPPK